MQVGEATPALDEELVAALGNLHDAALDARPYVKKGAGASLLVGDGEAAFAAPDVLDALDGALADAGELLGRVDS